VVQVGLLRRVALRGQLGHHELAVKRLRRHRAVRDRQSPADAEVRDLHDAAGVLEDVAGVQVLVDHLALVHEVQRPEELLRDVEDGVRVQLRRARDVARQVAGRPLEHQVEPGEILEGVEDVRDVGVVELLQQRGLGEPAFAHLGIRRARSEHLDGEVVLEDVDRIEDRAEASRRDRLREPVAVAARAVDELPHARRDEDRRGGDRDPGSRRARRRPEGPHADGSGRRHGDPGSRRRRATRSAASATSRPEGGPARPPARQPPPELAD